MINFPVSVKIYCKACDKLFESSVFNELHLDPQHDHLTGATFTLEELKKGISKEIKDVDGNIVGIMSLKGFEFKIACPKCCTTNNYKVKDLIY